MDKMINDETTMIGDIINQIRKDKNITLTELADKANIAKSNLSNIERNINQNPSIKVLERLAEVLEVNLTTLLGIKDEEKFNHLAEEEWNEFIKSLKKQQITKTQLKEYQKVIEFIDWKTTREGEGS